MAEISSNNDIGGYTFLSNNCAKVLSNYLQSSGIVPNYTTRKFPKRIERWLHLGMFSPYPPIVMPSFAPTLMKSLDLLEIKFEMFLTGESWPKDSSKLLISNLSNSELILLIHEIDFMPTQVFLDSIKRLEGRSVRSTGRSFDKVYGLHKILDIFYSFCTSSLCAEKIRKDENNLWSKRLLKKKRNYRKSLYYGGIFNRNKLSPAMYHLEQLVK